MKILILATDDNCITQMAKGWLSYFDNTILVTTAGIQKAGILDPQAIQVMDAAGIDISKYSCNHFSVKTDEKWDYVIALEGKKIKRQAKIIGRVGCWVSMDFPDPSKQSGSVETIRVNYQVVCNEIRDRLFDFYLLQIRGKEILGADSCGAECDL
ncbi:MAG: hypothetical protein ACRCSQ_02645 [Bacteroidales bacterium]